MATKKIAPPVGADQGADEGQQQSGEVGTLVKARVLVDCYLGKCNDVVEVDEIEVEALKGVVDTTPEAVAYAESLQKE